MTTSLGQTVLYSLITPVRVVAVANVAGTYYNGPANNGVGATLTIAASSLTIDSVVLEVGDRVLLTTQTSTYQNGIYIIKEIGSTVILQRSDDQQNIEQLKIGQLVTVGAGTVNAGSAFVLVAPLPQFIGIDAFLWASSPLSGALGTAGSKAASDNSLSTVASTAGGGFVVGNFTMATDTLGTIEDSGVAPGDLFLNNLTDGHIFVGDATNNAADVAVTGDVLISNAGVTSIATGVIVNADINASAAIAFSKLATLASGNLLVGSAGGVATSVAVTGDVTISNAGVTAIAAGVIVNADINAAAAIAFSKLATLPSAEILVGSPGGVATAVAVTGDVTISNAGVTAIAADSIVNADVNSAAAIAFSKLATLASANILVGSAGGVATSVAMSGDVTISNAGVTTIGAGAIDLAMLSAGITPAAVIKFFDQVTTVGGAAAEAFAVAGALAASDRAFVQVVDDGGSNVTVLQAVVTNDTLTVTFSANPGNDTVINYQIIRAAA